MFNKPLRETLRNRIGINPPKPPEPTQEEIEALKKQQRRGFSDDIRTSPIGAQLPQQGRNRLLG